MTAFHGHRAELEEARRRAWTDHCSRGSMDPRALECLRHSPRVDQSSHLDGEKDRAHGGRAPHVRLRGDTRGSNGPALSDRPSATESELRPAHAPAPGVVHGLRGCIPQAEDTPRSQSHPNVEPGRAPWREASGLCTRRPTRSYPRQKEDEPDGAEALQEGCDPPLGREGLQGEPAGEPDLQGRTGAISPHDDTDDLMPGWHDRGPMGAPPLVLRTAESSKEGSPAATQQLSTSAVIARETELHSAYDATKCTEAGPESVHVREGRSGFALPNNDVERRSQQAGRLQSSGSVLLAGQTADPGCPGRTADELPEPQRGESCRLVIASSCGLASGYHGKTGTSSDGLDYRHLPSVGTWLHRRQDEPCSDGDDGTCPTSPMLPTKAREDAYDRVWADISISTLLRSVLARARSLEGLP